jgi:hypothetical protein
MRIADKKNTWDITSPKQLLNEPPSEHGGKSFCLRGFAF